MTTGEGPVEVDRPCPGLQEDEASYVWAFLDEARVPSQVVEGATVVSGDELDPVFAGVVWLTARPGGTRVHLGIQRGAPLQYAEALRPAHLLTA